MRAPPPCSLAAYPQRASPETQITEGKPLPAGMAAAIFPPITRRRVRDCGGHRRQNAEPHSEFRVGHKISVRIRTLQQRRCGSLPVLRARRIGSLHRNRPALSKAAHNP
jgi:hypothetical protein